MSDFIEKEKNGVRRIYELVVINTIGAKNIPDLVEGAVISTFGLLLCFTGLALALYLDAPFSAAILKLGFLGYLSVLLYHFINIRELKLKDKPISAGRLVIFLSKVLGVLLLLAVLDVGMGVSRMLAEAANTAGSLEIFLSSLPALLVIGLPLFFWQQLCEYTVIDDFVRRKLNE